MILHILRQAGHEVSNGPTVGVPRSEDMLASPAGTHGVLVYPDYGPSSADLAPKRSAGVAPM